MFLTVMTYPEPKAVPGAMRPRRLRRSAALRELVREHRLAPAHLVLPLFVTEVENEPVEIASMPGAFRWPVERVDEPVGEAVDAGVGAVLLFGIPAHKDPRGSQASATDGVVQRAVRALRASGFTGVVITDVCLCEYTDHGHCGLLDSDGVVLNDPSLERLADAAVSLAQAGADVVAPSAMMDGQVAAIRSALDEAGAEQTAILSYSAKYASSYYGPFRDAADGAPAFGDRKSHQMDPGNAREAIREHRLDIAEGADVLMVKPGLSYLDIVRRSREAFPDVPLAAYNVSGEYSMVKAAAARGWIDERSVVLETLLSFRRAGADMIITYHALDAARWLGEAHTL
ncbi:MAG: porphobilinogen synthase [Gemmatimonadota bacterium]|nr:porphobilinogen synthase [Gemmatimonadota bacterium]